MPSLFFFFLNFIDFDFSKISLVINQNTETINNLNEVVDSRSLLLGIFFGFMIVMAIYNLLLYFFLRDRAYLLYVGIVVFNILTTLATNGVSGQFFWPNHPDLDGIIYITFAGISMFCSSRFTAVFLELKKSHKLLNKLMWLIAYFSLLLTFLSLFLTIEQITPFGRWLVLLSFPSYIIVAIIAYKKGFKPALFYLIAWIPYVLGLVIRVMHGAGWLPDSQLILSSLEIGGALEIVLLSFALAYRIKGMQEENTQIRIQLQNYILQIGSLEQKIESSHSINENQSDSKIAKIAKEYDLTDREADVLLQITNGLTNQQIADELFISINTVKYHTKNIYEKLNVKKRTEITSKILFDN